MELYMIGVLMTFGRMMEDESLKEKGFKNTLLLLLGLVIWPVVWGNDIAKLLQKYLDD